MNYTYVMDCVILLIFMLFSHIIDDYYLQGILASMKQKSWWKKNCPSHLYKYYENDYIIALIEHAFSWTVMINIPIIVHFYIKSIQINPVIFIILFIINWVVHAMTDNAKANLYEINLIQDQCIHIMQVIITWFIFIFLN